jgi:alginate O-acetyltransferase complex protein AlgI
MLFTEPTFLLLFLPATLLLYFAAPRAAKNLLLTAASLLFYAWGEWRFLPWLVASVALNYWLAVWLARTPPSAKRRWILAFGIASDLALLLVFKYAGFAVQNLNGVLHLAHLGAVTLPAITLPLGISFFTFHKISYKVDVYRGNADAKKNPIDLALYILLFPQLIAGPIVRYNEISDQIVERQVRWPHLYLGVRRFIVGFGKKMILANTVALPADQIFSLPTNELTTPVAWLGIVCYTLQIYFDFSGYSDMAIGLASMFGFTFPENFNYPYLSTSITEFWRRWHISLSRWFRDYLYIPLGGNRAGALATYRNLLLVFFLCGLWHGASWTFVLWGLFHGGFLIVERLRIGKWLAAAPRPLQRVYTLGVVMIGWVFFRADGLRHAAGYLLALGGLARGSGAAQHLGLYLNGALLLALVAGMVGATPVCGWVQHRFSEWTAGADARLSRLAQAAAGGVSACALTLVFLVSAMMVAAGTYNPFIYFRF